MEEKEAKAEGVSPKPDEVGKGAARVFKIHLREPTEKQRSFLLDSAKRKVIRAGRRSGKTVGAAMGAVEWFLAGQRILYGTPTAEQVSKFWFEVSEALREPIEAGVLYRNETERIIEKRGTENRLRAKTAWNADTLRGDYANRLILDEYQLMSEDTWGLVGAPMLADKDGDAMFFYTPPSLSSRGMSKARDPLHASKLFRKAQEDVTGRWKAFTFTSHENPHISKEALKELANDMTREAYQHEIMAEDEELSPNQLVYGVFNEATQVIKRFLVPESWPRYTGHDFGGANPAALFVAQDPATGYFYVEKEYLPGKGRSTFQHVEAFKELTKGTNVLKRSGGSHQEEEIREGYLAQGWPIQEPFLKGVNPQIDRVRGIMELNKLFIFSDLYELMREIRNYLWRMDGDGRITDEIYDKASFHLMDCLRYVLSDFRPETVVETGWKIQYRGNERRSSLVEVGARGLRPVVKW